MAKLFSTRQGKLMNYGLAPYEFNGRSIDGREAAGAGPKPRLDEVNEIPGAC